MPDRMIKANGVELWTEAFGSPDAEPMLLIMGASVQSIFWPEELIDALVSRGRYVIRFDNRDTGASQSFDFIASPYTLDDMALDAIGVLDAYGLPSAHVCGLSMGGMITQILMIQHRHRIRTAVLFMTSPLSGAADQDAQGDTPVLMSGADLPGPSAEWTAKAIEWMSLPADSDESRIHKRVESLAMMIGSAESFDRERAERLATLEVGRARNYAAMDNHPLAIAATRPTDRRPLLREVDIPTLVIHGTDDPILPFPHGRALADVIPNAQFVSLEGIGHSTAQISMEEVAASMLQLQPHPEGA